MGVPNHIPGVVRYFTYYLEFPDGDRWVNQTPFVHSLDFVMTKTRFGMDPMKKTKLMRDGECHWKDHNGVTHRVVIEAQQRPINWGVKRKKR